jgi:hypothetical protein
MSFSLLNRDVVSLLVGRLSDSSLLSLSLVDVYWNALAKAAMLARVSAYIGYEPNRLGRVLATYRQVGMPRVYDTDTASLVDYEPISSRRDVGKAFVQGSRLHYIDIHEQCGYVDDEGSVTVYEGKTRDAIARTHGAEVLRLVGNNIVAGSVDISRVSNCKRLVAATYDDRVCFMTCDNELAVCESYTSETKVVFNDAESYYVDSDSLPSIYAVTSTGVYSGSPYGRLDYLCRHWSLLSIRRCAPVMACVYRVSMPKTSCL